jgi:hypothetical protein
VRFFPNSFQSSFLSWAKNMLQLLPGTGGGFFTIER